MKQSTNKKGKSLEDILKQHDVELTSGWAKLASLVMAYEGIEWKEAGAKARDLLNSGKGEAQNYIKEVRSHFTVLPSSKTKGRSKTKSKTKTKKTKVKAKRDRFSTNYRRLLKIAPQLEDELLSGQDVYGSSEVTGYFDLTIELISTDKSGFYIFLEQSLTMPDGENVPDPGMLVLVNVKDQTAEALTFQNQFGSSEVYPDGHNKRKLVRPEEKKSQNYYLEKWLLKLINQNHFVKFEDFEPENEIIEAEVRQMEGEVPEPSKSIESIHEELSFMDEDVIAEIKELAVNSILDEVIQTVLKDGKSKQPKIRAVARYFLIKRINESMLGVTVEYPSFGEIRQDYEKLVAEQNKSREVDKLAKEMATETKVNESDIAETVKHWTKLTAVIQNVEGLEYEQAKEKALELKKSGNAEDYVITAFNRKYASGNNQLYRLNYQQLLRLIPSLSKGKIKDQSGEIKRQKDQDELRLKYEGMDTTVKSVEVLSIEKVKKNEIQILAINKASKKTWLLTRNGNFDGKSDYEHDSASTSERLKANQELGNWLKVMLHYGSEDINKNSPKSDDFEHPIAKLLKKHPIAIEWSEGSTDENLGVGSIEKLENKFLSYNYPKKELQGYAKTKVWFRGYEWYVRIDLSPNEGDYYPKNMNLLEWLKKGDPNFNWEQFSDHEKSGKSKDKKADKIPDFKVGKVKLVDAHIKAGLDQKDIDWINKHKRGMTITPLKEMKNKTKSFAADMVQQALKPGWRISKTGKLYWENRSNRSDLTNEGI